MKYDIEEQLAIIMEYLWSMKVDSQKIKNAVDVWYQIKEEATGEQQ